jgi:hypothetical protein
VAANLSFLLARQGIELANAASAALAGRQVDAANVTATIRTLALAPIGPGSLLTSLLVGVLVVLAVVLAGTCLVRVMLVVFLVVAAPVMPAAHALPETEGLARLWWRAMVACLGVQLAQALALVMAVRVFLEADRQEVLPLGGGFLYCNHTASPAGGDGFGAARNGAVFAVWGDNLLKMAPCSAPSSPRPPAPRPSHHRSPNRSRAAHSLVAQRVRGGGLSSSATNAWVTGSGSASMSARRRSSSLKVRRTSSTRPRPAWSRIARRYSSSANGSATTPLSSAATAAS